MTNVINITRFKHGKSCLKQNTKNPFVDESVGGIDRWCNIVLKGWYTKHNKNTKKKCVYRIIETAVYPSRV